MNRHREPPNPNPDKSFIYLNQPFIKAVYDSYCKIENISLRQYFIIHKCTEKAGFDYNKSFNHQN